MFSIKAAYAASSTSSFQSVVITWSLSSVQVVTLASFLGPVLASLIGQGEISDKLIDYNDPLLGTFQQRYYFAAEFHGPGGVLSLIWVLDKVNIMPERPMLSNAVLPMDVGIGYRGLVDLLVESAIVYSVTYLVFIITSTVVFGSKNPSASLSLVAPNYSVPNDDPIENVKLMTSNNGAAEEYR
ncbi:hypothetical protein BDZ89DRAFT_1109112 [Hymenopellis radicata]|nr:hypothetical protein BDZ89DRAFT_1109112 [Hymenopellis radicata]